MPGSWIQPLLMADYCRIQSTLVDVVGQGTVVDEVERNDWMERLRPTADR